MLSSQSLPEGVSQAVTMPVKVHIAISSGSWSADSFSNDSTWLLRKLTLAAAVDPEGSVQICSVVRHLPWPAACICSRLSKLVKLIVAEPCARLTTAFNCQAPVGANCCCRVRAGIRSLAALQLTAEEQSSCFRSAWQVVSKAIMAEQIPQTPQLTIDMSSATRPYSTEHDVLILNPI